MFELIKQTLTQLKYERPLILNITNDVTMGFIANGLLSIGASPIMCKSINEIEELVKMAKTVVINIGTLDDAFIALCQQACFWANHYGKPVILDPVGAGASLYRTQESIKLLEKYRIAIIRANASEIIALAGEQSTSKGVDSLTDSEQAVAQARLLAEKYQLCVCMSGQTDFIISNNQHQQLNRGSAIMPTVTGTGCLLSAVVAAYHAVNKNAHQAATLAALYYSVCGELAEQVSNKPGTFMLAFLDALNSQPLQEQYERI